MNKSKSSKNRKLLFYVFLTLSIVLAVSNIITLLGLMGVIGFSAEQRLMNTISKHVKQQVNIKKVSELLKVELSEDQKKNRFNMIKENNYGIEDFSEKLKSIIDDMSESDDKEVLNAYVRLLNCANICNIHENNRFYKNVAKNPSYNDIMNNLNSCVKDHKLFNKDTYTVGEKIPTCDDSTTLENDKIKTLHGMNQDLVPKVVKLILLNCSHKIQTPAPK